MIPNRAQLIAELRKQHASSSASPAFRAALAEIKDDPPRNPLDEAISEWWATLQSPSATDEQKLAAVRQLFSHVRE